MQFEYSLLLEPRTGHLPVPSCSDFYLVPGDENVRNLFYYYRPYFILVEVVSNTLSGGSLHEFVRISFGNFAGYSSCSYKGFSNDIASFPDPHSQLFNIT